MQMFILFILKYARLAVCHSRCSHCWSPFSNIDLVQAHSKHKNEPTSWSMNADILLLQSNQMSEEDVSTGKSFFWEGSCVKEKIVSMKFHFRELTTNDFTLQCVVETTYEYMQVIFYWFANRVHLLSCA